MALTPKQEKDLSNILSVNQKTAEAEAEKTFAGSDKKDGKHGGDSKSVRALAQGLVFLKSYLVWNTASLFNRISDLESRLEEMEKTGAGLKYMGVFQRAITYEKGAVVSHQGSAWICLANNAESAPGSSDAWQLMVKKGLDAR